MGNISEYNYKDRRRLALLGLVCVILVVAIAYSNILTAPFVFDDYSSIKENEQIRRIDNALRMVSSNRSVPLISFALNYAVGGLNTAGYHLVNIIIHAVNALLIYYLILLTYKTPFFRGVKTAAGSQAFIAFSAAFIFAAHPIQTQAVTYVVQRFTSMATMFYLLSLIMYVKSRLRTNGRPAPVSYVLSFVFAVAAMKSKEIALTLPIIAVLYEFLFFNDTKDSQPKTQAIRRLLYLLPIILTLLIIPLSMLDVKAPVQAIVQDIDLSSKETAAIGRADYLMTQFRVIITYIRLLLFPVNQSLDYAYPVYKSFFNKEVFLSFCCLTALAGSGIFLLVRSRNRVTDAGISAADSRLLAFGIFWFFITLSVESSIMPIRDVIVEHRLYLPSAGIILAFVVLIRNLLPSSKAAVAAVAIIVIMLSVGAYRRNITWNSPQTLWEDVITKGNVSARAYNNLGVAYKESGDNAKALEQFNKAIETDRFYTESFFNLGDVYYRLRAYDTAAAYLETALELKLTPMAHLAVLNKLGRAYSAKGETDRAIEIFKEAIRLFPSGTAPYNNLGVQYIKIGEFELAIETYEKGLLIKNEPVLVSNLEIAKARKAEREKNAASQK